MINKIIKAFLVVVLLMYAFFEVTGGEKYIRFSSQYPFKIDSSFTFSWVTLLSDSNAKQGPKVINLFFERYYHEKYFKIQKRFNDYIKFDTLILRIELFVRFSTDSLPKNQFVFPKDNIIGDCETSVEDTITFIYKGQKKLTAVFIDDTAEVNIIWKMNELEISPFWFGDY